VTSGCMLSDSNVTAPHGYAQGACAVRSPQLATSAPCHSISSLGLRIVTLRLDLLSTARGPYIATNACAIGSLMSDQGVLANVVAVNA